MADNQDAMQKDTKECCSSEKGCGCGCGGKKSCCGAKALLLLLTILVAGIIGYLIGSGGCGRGWHHGMFSCPMSMMGAPGQPIPSK